MQLQRVADDLVDVDAAPLRRPSPRERQELPDDARGAVALALDGAGALPHRAGEHLVGAEQLGRHQDRRQRVVQLVGDTGQERAERLQLVGLDELVLRLLQLAQPRLQLGIEAGLLERQRRLVRDAAEDAALLVAQAARGAVVDGQHADGLIANAERHGHAGVDAVGREMRGDGEAALGGQVVDLHERLLQKRVAREGIGRGQDRQRADVARVPAHARFEPQAAARDVEQEQADEIGAERIARQAHRLIADRVLVGELQQMLREVVQALVVARPPRQRVERASVLDRGRRLGAERREQLDVAWREVALPEIEDGQRAVHLAGLARERDGQDRAEAFAAHPGHDLAGKGHGRIVVEQRGEDGAPLGDRDARGALPQRQSQPRHQRVADGAGAAHCDQHAAMRVVAEEDRAVGAADVQRFGRDRVGDLA